MEPDGPSELVWDSQIEVWEPGRHLRTTYPLPGAEGRGEAIELAVDYYLEARGGGTYLRLVHSGFGPQSEWDEEYDGVRRGWQYELRSLRHYLERDRAPGRLGRRWRWPCPPRKPGVG